MDTAAENLTGWGYQYTQTDPGDGSYGGMLTRMLFTTLPDYYPPGSAYAHFPFMVPAAMKAAMEQRDPASVAEYDWQRPFAQPAILSLAVAGGSGDEGLYRERVKRITGRVFEREIVSVGLFCLGSRGAEVVFVDRRARVC